MPFTNVDEPSCGGGARVFSAAKGRSTTFTLLRRIEGVVAKICINARRARRVALLNKKFSSNRRPIDFSVDIVFRLKSLTKSRVERRFCVRFKWNSW